MKLLLFLSPLFALFACNNGPITNLFVEKTEFPYIVDSSYVDNVISGNYKKLEVKDLKTLYLDVKRHENCKYKSDSIILSLVKEDSLKKANAYDVRNESSTSIYAVDMITFNTGSVGYLWTIRVTDNNIRVLDLIYITFFKEGKPHYCFPLPIQIPYSSNNIYWTTYVAEIFADGKILINAYNKIDLEFNTLNKLLSIEWLITEEEVVLKDYKNENSEILSQDDVEHNETKESNMNYNEFDAISVGNELELRADPSFDAEIITLYNTGELLILMENTDSREVQSDGIMCDDYGYYWYKVRNSWEPEGYEGWVYGKYIFELNGPSFDNGPLPGQAEIYCQLGNEMYILNYAYDLSYGADDESGPTGCYEFYMPYFYKEGDKVMPIYYDKERFPSNDLGWKSEQFDEGVLFLVLESEMGADKITEINDAVWNDNPALEFIIYHSYQDGGAKSRVLVSNISGRFEVVDYELLEEEY